MSAAVQVAKQITALIPARPKVKLVGGGDANLATLLASYGAYRAAAVGAWRYAASLALAAACVAAPRGWNVDHQGGGELIMGTHDINDLEAMCQPDYPWSGRQWD